MRPENKEENNGKNRDVHQQRAYTVQRADDNMKRDPGDEKPACPVTTIEHKHTGNDLEKAREMNIPVAFEVRGHQAAD